MSGFKSWNDNNDNQLNININSNNSNLQQWGETPTTLFTYKEVSTSKSVQSELGFFTTSDVNLKTNIKDLSNNKKEHLDKLRNLIPKSYNFKNQETTSFGLIAQEVEKIFPSLVVDHEDAVGNGETYKSLKYSVLPTILLKAMQEQQKMIQELKAEIELLKSK